MDTFAVTFLYAACSSIMFPIENNNLKNNSDSYIKSANVNAFEFKISVYLLSEIWYCKLILVQSCETTQDTVNQWFSHGSGFAPRGYFTMSQDVFSSHNLGQHALGI